MKRNAVLLWFAVIVAAIPLLPAGTASAGPQGKLVYWVMADLVRGVTQPTAAICLQTSVFKAGEQVVWRVRVLDVSTGQDPGEEGKNQVAIVERGLKVTAYLETGQGFAMRYGQHPGRPKPGESVVWLWSTAWNIPDDYPSGRLKWWVVVTDKTGAFVRFDPIGAGAGLPATYITIERR